MSLRDVLQDCIHRFGYHLRKHRIFYKKVKGENLIGAEIGVFKGRNARRLLKNLDISKLYLIDPYGDLQNYKGWGSGEEEAAEAEKVARSRLKKYNNKIQWIKKLSDNAVDYIDELDFAYIDANHSYEYVNKELLATSQGRRYYRRP